MKLVFPAAEPVIVPVTNGLGYPIRRIFCVGQNYAAHAAEMGGRVDREAPWFFTKSTMAYCPNDKSVSYPDGTDDYHHEVELVVALGDKAHHASARQASDAIFGYAVGLDMTRRDRQKDAKEARRPWSLGKDVEHSAPMASICPKADFGDLSDKTITLAVNGDLRQSSRLSDMVWSPVEIVSYLSRFYHLDAGDVIMTGTPSGVGPVSPGDRLVAKIDGLETLVHRIEG